MPTGAGPRSLAEPVSAKQTISGREAVALMAPWNSAGAQMVPLF